MARQLANRCVATSRARYVSIPAALAVVGSVAVAGCAANDRSGDEAPAIVLNPITADDLLDAIGDAGLEVPHPRDVTSRDCPEIGCAQKVETDTVSIIKFPTPGTAELYAGSTQNRFQIINVVITFPASLPADQRAAYADAVKRAIG